MVPLERYRQIVSLTAIGYLYPQNLHQSRKFTKNKLTNVTNQDMLNMCKIIWLVLFNFMHLHIYPCYVIVFMIMATMKSSQRLALLSALLSC